MYIGLDFFIYYFFSHIMISIRADSETNRLDVTELCKVVIVTQLLTSRTLSNYIDVRTLCLTTSTSIPIININIPWLMIFIRIYTSSTYVTI